MFFVALNNFEGGHGSHTVRKCSRDRTLHSKLNKILTRIVTRTFLDPKLKEKFLKNIFFKKKIQIFTLKNWLIFLEVLVGCACGHSHTSKVLSGCGPYTKMSLVWGGRSLMINYIWKNSSLPHVKIGRLNPIYDCF